jgi:hypothetical protein
MMFMPMLALWDMASRFGISSLVGGSSVGMFVLGIFLMAFSLKRVLREPQLPIQN